MIGFNSETEFELEEQEETKAWLNHVARLEGFDISEVNYIFCNDEYLLNLNKSYLNHDTYTDVIGFDYSIGKNLQGDIYISIDRVRENAQKFDVKFKHELHRVMVHGLLHFCGWSDKSDSERAGMREREDFHLSSALLN
ncbi:MAG: rRNA maturation RNase YbeY [Bacteroidia bacterium]|nr:rRNA maturation RNase YbeY [Bacteroidia bacterium]MBT8267688.1 rRNA maturation RNase YbeY [Bacteroidia bacterium]NNF82102.1 rRNA maturation RNase YbeY [Flavobacteriaceae bacterium]NNK70434.1 rRNA maturation RNase YbeY [Flavobacteriaceae bacterium]NNL80094.1 rRNA maturation RNase YbeY [Flavobacteriaceae bacterium]